MNLKSTQKGIAIMLCSSLCTCVGQLFWKISSDGNPILWIISGFMLYGFGALLMILALRYGDLSVLHPMLGVGYILSIVLGYFVLGEPVHYKKVLGIIIILFGLLCLSRSGGEET